MQKALGLSPRAAKKLGREEMQLNVGRTHLGLRIEWLRAHLSRRDRAVGDSAAVVDYGWSLSPHLLVIQDAERAGDGISPNSIDPLLKPDSTSHRLHDLAGHSGIIVASAFSLNTRKAEAGESL